MDSTLHPTPFERMYLSDGKTVVLAHARYQNFLNATVFIGSPVDEETYAFNSMEHQMVPADEVQKRVAIGVTADGAYQEDPASEPWSQRV